MGGGNSEISDGTTRVLLECAYFDPRGVRRAARRHGLHTEASHRFERGVDWGDTRAALARAASLVAPLARAERGEGAARLRGAAPWRAARCTLRTSASARCSASTVAADARRARSSTRLGFAAARRASRAWTCGRCRASGPTCRARSTSSRRSRACAGFDAIPTHAAGGAPFARRGAARGACAVARARRRSRWG